MKKQLKKQKLLEGGDQRRLPSDDGLLIFLSENVCKLAEKIDKETKTQDTTRRYGGGCKRFIAFFFSTFFSSFLHLAQFFLEADNKDDRNTSASSLLFAFLLYTALYSFLAVSASSQFCCSSTPPSSSIVHSFSICSILRLAYLRRT